MARRGNILRFYRGARRHPKWDMGTPPGSPRKGRKGSRSRKRLWGIALAILLLGPSALDAASLAWRQSDGCRIWAVVDGDTVKMHCPASGFVTGRIMAYDTPELKARCPRELALAVAATYALRWHLWTAREVGARTEGQDRYGRHLTVLIADGEGVARRMVRAGLARWYDGGRRASWCRGGRTA